MSYTVKEIFYTLQGEGANAGRAAVFCRFSGCNLWTGREEDRSRAVCRFCDTDFVGTGPEGGRFENADSLAAAVERAWRGDADARRFVVCTGGEPLLQVDDALIRSLRSRGFVVAVETNGTRRAPDGLDWICVSPKAGAPLLQTSGSEIKLIFPQPLAMPEQFALMRFEHFFIQPMDGADVRENTERAIEYCMRHPQWRLSLQTHKQLGIR
ncbi:MAG: 7-carboxy-7-deazaguanine synthase [Gemmatimonadaceae bacterium]|nr:7-carboxy-7-deazaguanine synthase [Gemmatimonadaceae bacterium]MDQ3242870.1 7-carboxy-7-deazaguanine synthase [Gemmatimonadota bacterium]